MIRVGKRKKRKKEPAPDLFVNIRMSLGSFPSFAAAHEVSGSYNCRKTGGSGKKRKGGDGDTPIPSGAVLYVFWIKKSRPSRR